ncbi:MAG: cytochrome c oxidase assembly protein [Gammaproteobacteria bacterium]|nr:cytochrome c oxidase assembly protein [Gammaproteobacteria bacterium]
MGRFNLDPVLIGVLLVLATLHLARSTDRRQGALAELGWAFAAAALISPLCALSVAMFSARIGQHMILVLVAAPLLALGLPEAKRRFARTRLWSSCAIFFLALWFWHMPGPYDATFESTAIYWTMHITLFGSALLLWREILQGSGELTADVLAAGGLTSMQMGLLGAVLTMAGRPLFFPHLTTTQAWGFTPLQDQQLGGVLMWVPGIALFLWAALRSLGRLRTTLERMDST